MHMKIFKTLLSLVIIISFGTLQAQDEGKSDQDKLMMVDGEQMMGKVISTKGTNVTFLAASDTLDELIPKEEIMSIHFADGEIVQLSMGFINRKAETWEAKMKRVNNKVAVIPFVYTDHFTEHEKGNMSLETQMNCVADIKAVNDVLDIQSADSTNAILARNDINWENIRHYVPAELASMLDVEFVVLGTVDVEPVGKDNKKENEFGTENQTLETPKGRKEGVALVPKKFATMVDVNIYDILGEVVYTNAQQSYWQTPDAYNMNLEYLINQSPFNTK